MSVLFSLVQDHISHWPVSKGVLFFNSRPFVVVQSLSHVQLFATLWTCSTLGFPVLHYLAEFGQTQVRDDAWADDAIQPSHLLLPPSLPTLNLSQHQGLFQWVGSSSNQVANYWSFSFSISPSNEYLGLISFRIDWFDLLQCKGLLRVHVVPCGKYMIEPQWKFLTTEAWVSFPGRQYCIMLPNISTRKVMLIHGKDNGIWSNNPTFECISKGIELRFSPRYLNTHIVC